jgi:hypothetical protein
VRYQVSHPYKIVAKCGVFYWRIDARHRFVSILHLAPRDLYWLHLPFWVGVATVGVATLSISFQTSFHISSQGSFGFATLGVGLPALSLTASRGFSWPDLEFYVVARSASVFRRRVGSHAWASLH